MGVGNSDALLALLYDELRQLARARLSSGGRNVTLDTTALVHESFLRLHKAGHLELEDRDHFLAYAASTMRSIVVDSIRRRRAERPRRSTKRRCRCTKMISLLARIAGRGLRRLLAGLRGPLRLHPYDVYEALRARPDVRPDVRHRRVVRAGRLMHGKASRVTHDGRGVYASLPERFSVIRYHSLAIEKASLPRELEVSSTASDGEIMGVRHRQLAATKTPLEGVQFHPESILTEHGHAMLRNFLAAAR